MSILPEVSKVNAISYEYFPTRWQLVIWRNWGYVPIERIAKALRASVEEIKEAAKNLGLDSEIKTDPIWEQRGYLTLIRNNWHLCTYEQILILLDWTEKQLAFTLKEDDFLWVKLGRMKPQVEAPVYTSLTKRQAQQTKEIAELFQSRFWNGQQRQDNGFAFLKDFYKPLYSTNKLEVKSVDNHLRIVCPYFALFGDVLMDDEVDILPESLLEEYAKVGINGIWIQIVLYQMVEFPFDTSLSVGWEKRIESLKRLVAKAKRYGIGIYPYLNEPRAMQEAFFEKYPHLQGEVEDGLYAMCTSTEEVQEYLYQSVKQLFEMVPDLAGYITITMSENLTNCYSRIFVEERKGERITCCPRCKDRMPWEVVAEVNNLMAKGAHDANPTAKTIVWTWGWPNEWAHKVIPLLTEKQIIQCTSEEALPFCIGGVRGSVRDYTMSMCGPSEKAKRLWNIAIKHGLEVSAKVQINNTWEMAAVPYIPVFDKIEQHIMQLKNQGVRHLHASWTLGGCPSPNLKLAEWLMEDKGTVKEFLDNWLGEKVAEGVYLAQKKLSHAFSQYPFDLWTLYYGPQNSGLMAPFFLEKTGYSASMVGYPYDDIEGWSSIYKPKVYEEQYGLLCSEWNEGIDLLESYLGFNDELDELIIIAKAILCQYESAFHHIQFVNLRDKEIPKMHRRNKEKILRIVREEMSTVQDAIKLRLYDSRIGYESSNHYFYTLQDLKEKMINLAYCEQKLISN